jgi:hydrogenase/urease accessory protein HupE
MQGCRTDYNALPRGVFPLPGASSVPAIRSFAELVRLLLFIAASLSAGAHAISLSYAEIGVQQTAVHWAVRLSIPEIDPLLGLDRDRDGVVDSRELMAARASIERYVTARVAVIQDGRPLNASVAGFRPWVDSEKHPFAEVDLVFASDRPMDRLTLKCDLLREVNAAHKTLARLDAAGRAEEVVFENGRAVQIDARPRWLASLGQFVRMGVLHIFTGYDHIAFLLGVVLIGGSLRTIVKVVTSFTLAHSITLALAALHIVTLPPRLVECGIALSIMYIALENLFFKQFDRRWIVTFFFGLIHGFGFASALQEVHLSGQSLAAALFSFNFGVEIGQLCIVAALLPALLYMARLQFGQALVKASSLIIFLLGSFWFWQRIAGA